MENASLTLSGMALPSGREFKRLRHANDPDDNDNADDDNDDDDDDDEHGAEIFFEI